jgi:hypothetical protein
VIRAAVAGIAGNRSRQTMSAWQMTDGIERLIWVASRSSKFKGA